MTKYRYTEGLVEGHRFREYARLLQGVPKSDLPGTRISRSSGFSVVSSAEIALHVPHNRIFYESGDYRQDTNL